MRREEHVRRLQIAMDDAAGVQRAERGQDAEADRNRLRRTQRPITELLSERLPFEQLHGDEQLAAVLADFVDLADVGMVDAGGGARFAPEALARGLVAPERPTASSARPSARAARRAQRRRRPCRLRRACARSRNGRCELAWTHRWARCRRRPSSSPRSQPPTEIISPRALHAWRDPSARRQTAAMRQGANGHQREDCEQQHVRAAPTVAQSA